MSHTAALDSPFVNFEQFTTRRLLIDSRNCQTPGVSPAKLEDLFRIKDEIGKTHKLYLADQLSVEGFGAIAKPLEERLGQLQTELPRLEAEVDFMRVNKLSADDVMHESNTMYDQWPTMASEDKRKVMEALVEKVTIGNGEIDITFSCVPSSEMYAKTNRG